MRTEQHALRTSLAMILVIGALGITFGTITGSQAILFDGMFSLSDAAMSLLAIGAASLITRSTRQAADSQLNQRFSFGVWQLEPLVVAATALVMMTVALYALVQAVLALTSGGRPIEFGPAVVYAVVVVLLTVTAAIVEWRANRRLHSALVAIDVKGWIMAGAVTLALLVAYVVGWLLEGTDAAWLTPYVDPGILAVVASVLVFVPLPDLIRAFSQIALLTPAALARQVDAAATVVQERHRLSGFQRSVAQVGRSPQAEVEFSVAPEHATRPLAEWDAIRRDFARELGWDPQHSWVTVFFTEQRHAPVESAD